MGTVKPIRSTAPQSGRATTPKAEPRRPSGPRFKCPLCSGEATITGTRDNPEFTCLDCTRFEIRTE